VWLGGKGECSIVWRTVVGLLFVCGRSEVFDEFGHKFISRQICKRTISWEEQKREREKHVISRNSENTHFLGNTCKHEFQRNKPEATAVA